MPDDWITTIGFMLATVAAAAGTLAALQRMRGGGAPAKLERFAVLIITLICGGVFVYRVTMIHQTWTPLATHADGLALLGVLAGMVTAYLQWTRRLGGIGLFALPVFMVLMIWGVCASWWSLRPFAIEGLWNQLHLLGVYGGLAGITLAAVFGALWLYVDRQLRSRDKRHRLERLGRLGSLEAIERAMQWAAMAGFVCLTVAVATGVVTMTDQTRPSANDWYAAKLIGAAVVWVIYALVMHWPGATLLRGRRAAWLAISGFVLLLAVLAIALVAGGQG